MTWTACLDQGPSIPRSKLSVWTDPAHGSLCLWTVPASVRVRVRVRKREGKEAGLVLTSCSDMRASLQDALDGQWAELLWRTRSTGGIAYAYG
jgi:hypothetical protein